jgi:hypothetical protein
VINWLIILLGDIRALVIFGAAVFGAIFVLLVWARTRALGPSVVALLTTAAMVWSVANVPWWTARAGEEAAKANNAPTQNVRQQQRR